MTEITQLIILCLLLPISVVIGSALYGPCATNEECGTFDTFCNNGTCNCLSDFEAVYDTCVKIFSPETKCTRKNKCHTIIGGRTMCKKGRCVCNSFHHLYNGQCVKSKSLDEMCESNEQCYCGKECQEKIGCFDGMCKCKKGYQQINRKCIGNPILDDEETTESSSINLVQSKHIFLLSIVIIFIKFVY